ncbi:MAG: T9SS type A sorting domain-containing protein [Saprospiraceae bacterium]|nr:T9SS type A sorting domain-containing protein [Saprospiraceae bacterium]
MKTKKLLFILTFLSVSSTMMAQTTPHFETALYIEDAIGNRDTVYFGFDPLATEDIDEDFGEEVLNTPFDSVLDARFTPPFSDAYFTKRIINKTANTIDGCWGGSGSFLYVHAIHQPVTISWAEADFYDECYRGTFIIDHYIYEVAGPIAAEDIAPQYYCMADVSECTYYLTADSLAMPVPQAYFRVQTEAFVGNSEQLDTIFGLKIDFDPIFGYTPCFWVTATEEPAGIEKVALFPNPATESVELQLSPNVTPEQVTIYDGVGRILARYPYKSAAIDITDLPSGIFIVEMLAEDGRRYVARGVKNN